MPQEKNKETPKALDLKVTSVPPAFAVDGSGIKIFPGGYAEIVFFQTVEQDKDSINARGICNVRMSLDQLKNFQNTINAVIEEQEKQEKK